MYKKYIFKTVYYALFLIINTRDEYDNKKKNDKKQSASASVFTQCINIDVRDFNLNCYYILFGCFSVLFLIIIIVSEN